MKTILGITEERMAQVVSYATIFMGIVVVYAFFLIIQPANWLKIVQPYKVISPNIGQGYNLNYEVEYCSSKELYLVVSRQLENTETGELWDVSDRATHFNKGCSKEIQNVLIPLRIDVGTYKLRDSVSIKVNPLRTDNYSYESASFSVGAY